MTKKYANLEILEEILEILEENINKGNPDVVVEEVTGKDPEDVFVN